MVDAICKRWKRTPPLSVSVAALVRGFGGKGTTESKHDAQNWHELQAAAASMGFGGGKPEWLTKT